MIEKLSMALFGIGLLACPFSIYSAENKPDWMVATWTAVSDEDGTPADVMEFRKDGKYVNYGFNCALAAEMPFHVYAGDIYVTSEVPNKGPISIVFRPSKDKENLTYTSPRTRNNAVYERLPSNPCRKDSK